MNQAQVLNISDFWASESPKERDDLNDGKKGTVYSRGGKLWVYFRYMNQRVREPVGLDDTPENRKLIRSKLDMVMAEIEIGEFEFARRFPYSKKKAHFTRLEGGTVRNDPKEKEMTFGEYYEKWFQEMKGGMSAGKVRDYESIAIHHLLPFFGGLRFSEFNMVLMKKFHAHLKGKLNVRGKSLSNKRILNIFIPLRVIVRDAIAEYGFDLADPFAHLKLPHSKKFRVMPFNYEEWKTLMQFIPAWYRPYFEFAVNTGLRPSEQVALKWGVIQDDMFGVVLSRVRGQEKEDLKTESSDRLIALTPNLKDVLERQRQLSAQFKSDYVFVNTEGRPVSQDKLREVWARAMKKSGLSYRRMYETRHTFASWALAAGETPEWVAKTLGHVDTSMIYRTYGRYIPNLTRRDGSAFERQYSAQIVDKKCPQSCPQSPN